MAQKKKSDPKSPGNLRIREETRPVVNLNSTPTKIVKGSGSVSDVGRPLPPGYKPPPPTEWEKAMMASLGAPTDSAQPEEDTHIPVTKAGTFQLADSSRSASSALEKLIAQGPAPTTTSTRTPLGVPAGYTAPGPLGRPTTPQGFVGPVASAPTQVAPRYFTGDEWVPASLPPEQIAQLQTALARAGLIAPTAKFRLGVWDDTSRNAYKNALETANASGVDDKTAISMYANAQPVNQDNAASSRAPLVKKLPNPDDLRATFTTAARSILGHKADGGLISRMISSYQQAVGAEQQSTYDAGGALDAQGNPTGGTVTQAPDASTFAEQQIRAANPAAAGAHDAVGVYGDFLKILGRTGTA